MLGGDKGLLPGIGDKDKRINAGKFINSNRSVIWSLFLGIIAVILALPVAAEETTGLHPAATPPNISASAEKGEFLIEIRISRETLDLYEKNQDGRWIPRRQYPVGTAVRRLHVYPLGKGKVTAISFNPWWYPTAYSRQVFRERGIDLPRAVPPGHPLNYMGAVKISLSHRTPRGAIYRIHGNNNPGRVGRRVTGGCLVMFNEDAMELAHTITVGTEVNILP
jgi:lipoprotein-anchoring transpeptidase ErfK/SrfK